MSNFTPLVNKQYEFEGDTVKVRFARLKRKHMFKLMPLIQQARDAVGEDGDKSKMAEFSTEMLGSMLDLLPSYVEEIDGLTDKAGNAISIDTVADDTYFIDLAGDIAMDILDASMVLKGADAKKS